MAEMQMGMDPVKKPEKTKGGFKLWQVIVSFVAGAGLVAIAFFTPVFGLQGFSRINLQRSVDISPVDELTKYKGPVPTLITGGETPVTGDEEPVSGEVPPPLEGPFTGELGQCSITNCDLSEQINQVKSLEITHYYDLLNLLHPVTGELGNRLDKIESML